jgi:hypothetical protein
MKFFVSIIVTALVAFACGLYLPWWTVAFASFLVAILIYQPPVRSFFTGFFGVLLLWMAMIIKINTSNETILAPKISMLMGFGNSVFALMLVSSLVGAIVGGLGALTGSLLRKVNQVKS